jgi:hypothetical protein
LEFLILWCRHPDRRERSGIGEEEALPCRDRQLGEMEQLFAELKVKSPDSPDAPSLVGFPGHVATSAVAMNLKHQLPDRCRMLSNICPACG